MPQIRVALIVDDDSTCRELVERMLGKKNYEVLSAESGEQALKMLDDSKPDVILLDIMMPNMNGFQVLQKVRESSHHYALPVIMLTAKSGDDDMMTAYQYGSDYYITKPFTADQLTYGIDMVLGRQPAGDGGASGTASSP